MSLGEAPFRCLRFLPAFGLLLCATAFANSHVIEPPAAWVTPAAVDLSRAVPEQQVAGGIHYRLVDSQIRFGGAEGKARYRHLAWEILDSGGLADNSSLEVVFQPEFQRVVIHLARVRRGDELIDQLDERRITVLRREQDLEALILDGSLTLSLLFDDVRVGDVVEYAYTVEGAAPALSGHQLGTERLQYGLPIARHRLRVLHERQHRLTVHRLGGAPAPRRQALGDWVELVWDFDDQPALIADDQLPPDVVAYPWVQLTDFPDWQSVAQWGAALYREPLTDRAGAAEIAEAIRDRHPTDRAAQAAAALAFVQEEVRYFGIEMGDGSLRPRPPALTLNRRYGDCKDKALLLVALLEELGIAAWPVLAATDDGAMVPLMAPSPFVFDHAIVVAHVDGRDYFLDPTLTGQATVLRNIVEPDYGHVLILRESETGPVDIAKRHVAGTVTIDEHFQPVEEGGYRYRVQTRYVAGEADDIRRYLASRSREEVTRDYRDYTARFYPNVTVDAPIAVEDDRALNVVDVTEHYRVDPLWLETEPGRLEADFYPWFLRDQLPVVNEASRQHPLAREDRLVARQRIRVELDDSWDLQDEQQSIEDPQFELDREITFDGRTLSMDYHLRLLDDRIDAERLIEFRERINQARDLLWYGLYSTSAQEPAQASDSSQAMESDWWWLLGLALAGMLVMLPGVAWFLAWYHRERSPWLGVVGAPRSFAPPSTALEPLVLTLIVIGAGLATSVSSATEQHLDHGTLTLAAMVILAAPLVALAQYAVQAASIKLGMRFLGHRRPYGAVFKALVWGSLPLAFSGCLLLVALLVWPVDFLSETETVIDNPVEWALFAGLLAQVVTGFLWSTFNELGSAGRVYEASRGRVLVGWVLGGVTLGAALLLAIGLIGLAL